LSEQVLASAQEMFIESSSEEICRLLFFEAEADPSLSESEI